MKIEVLGFATKPTPPRLCKSDFMKLDSPAVASALKALSSAIEEEVVRNTPSKGASKQGSSSEKADALVESLEKEIATLKKKLQEAEKKAEAAQAQAAKGSDPLSAFFNCLTCGLPEKWAAEKAARLAEQKKALRAELEPEIRKKLKKVMEDASLKIKDTTPIMETGITSLDFMAMNKECVHQKAAPVSCMSCRPVSRSPPPRIAHLSWMLSHLVLRCACAQARGRRQDGRRGPHY